MSTLPILIKDFMSARATPDTGYLQLSSGELEALQEYIRYAQELLSDIIRRSEHHARYFRRWREEPSPQDFEILEEQALILAERAGFALSLLDEADQALDQRQGYHTDPELSELLGHLASDYNAETGVSQR